MSKRKHYTQKAVYRKYGIKSGLEESFRETLIEKNIDFGYETEKIGYIEPAKERKYTPDFKLKKKDGETMFIETKGRWVADDRKKMKLIKEQYPNLDIRIVFQNANNKITKSSKTTYAMAAEKIGLRWADKTIPDEWINEIL